MYSMMALAIKMEEKIAVIRTMVGALGYLVFFSIEIYSICSITNSVEKSVNFTPDQSL